MNFSFFPCLLFTYLSSFDSHTYLKKCPNLKSKLGGNPSLLGKENVFF